MGTLWNVDGTTGQLKIEDGSVSALALAFISDPDTGIYNAGANDIALATNGAKALEINSSQQIIVPKTSNQLIIGTTNTVTISSTAPVASRVLTIPAATGDRNFLLSGEAAIVNADVSASAVIARSKTASGTAYRVLANDSSGVMAENSAITASRAVASDANGQLVAATTTAAELDFVSGVSSAVQTQLNAKLGNAGDTSSGDITFSNQKGIILKEQTGNGTNYVKIEAADSLTADTTYKFPIDGTAGYILSTDGSGNLSWISSLTAGGWTDYGVYVQPTTLTDQIRFGDGAVGTPSISFASDVNTGLYWIGADDIGFSTNGTLRLDVSTTALTSTLPIVLPVGAVGTLSLTFTGDTDTGIYRVSANDLGLVAGGVAAVGVTSTEIDIYVPITPQFDGTAGAPVYSWAIDPDTGIYRSGTNNLSFSTAGVLAGEFDANGMLRMNVGAAATPSYTFAGDADTGIYRSVANVLAFACNGVQQGYFSPTTFAINQQLECPVGSAGTPSMSFWSDPDTGIYDVGANILGFATNGTLQVQINAAGDVTLAAAAAHLNVPDGTVALPGIAFNSDPDTGIYRSAANALSFTTGGIIKFEVGIAVNYSYQDLQPSTAGTLNLGGTSYYWGRSFLADGSVASPAYTFASDPDTGIYRIGANDLGFATNGTKALGITSSQQIVQPAQPCFSAYLGATGSNVTGDGTLYYPAFETEIYDVGAIFNSVSGVFTAPVTGKYQFNVYLCATDSSTLATGTLSLVTSNRTYSITRIMSVTDAFVLSVLADMDASDVAYVVFSASGGSKVVDVLGHATIVYTSFSGSLIN